jgi:glycosyltransferase involved in cell wall biosynthesis
MPGPRHRPPVSFIAWSSVAGRSQEVAEALGGDWKCFFDFGFVDARLIPLRYLASAIRTCLYLAIRRPRAVIASNPPIFPGLIAYLYGRLSGAPVVLDSHPSAFGFYESKKMVTLTMPIHRFLIPRVRGTIVTNDELVRAVEEQGGEATIVHEAPPVWEVAAPRPLAGRPVVLYVGIFADDEPAEAVAAAARELPEVDFWMTGDRRRCPPELAASAPANLRLTGFLGPAAFRDAIERADVMMTLTERPEAVNRAANEAVWAQRPLIVSDWPTLAEFFPRAVRVSNSPDSIAAGVSEALARHEELRAAAAPALEEQRRRWESQLASLREYVDVGASVPS